MTARTVGEVKTDDHEPILQFFVFSHLREDLQPVAKQFAALAYDMHAGLKRSPERTVCFRKLLEAKDAAVRAKLYDPEG